MAENLVQELDDLDLKFELDKPLSNFSVISEAEECYNGVINWNAPKSDFKKCLTSGGSFSSGWFYIGRHSNCCFYLTVYPIGKDVNGANHCLIKTVCLSVHFNGKLPENAWVEGTVCVVGRGISKKFTASNNVQETDLENFDVTQKLWSYIMTNDFIIQCSIKMKFREVKCEFDGRTVNYELTRKFNSYGKILFRDQNFPDVTFRLQGREIKAHRLLLFKVPYFEKLFADESKQTFELSNIKFNIFKHVLEFIYTGDIPLLDFRLASELYVTANDLEICPLKMICASYLGASLTVKNVIIVLNLSNECNDLQLKKECFQFIQNSDVEALTKDCVIF